MKLLKIGLRFWITFTSLISFLTGWILLAHSPKPASASSSGGSNSGSSIPTLEPLQSLQNFQGGDDNIQSAPQFDFQQQNQFPQQRFRPAFRSGGS